MKNNASPSGASVGVGDFTEEFAEYFVGEFVGNGRDYQEKKDD
jgi:hypothetical protein